MYLIEIPPRDRKELVRKKMFNRKHLIIHINNIILISRRFKNNYRIKNALKLEYRQTENSKPKVLYFVGKY